MTFSMPGARYTWANVRAVWKSAAAVAPSPIQADAILVSPLMAEAMAQPTACTNCVARLPDIEKKPASRTEYITGSCRPDRKRLVYGKRVSVLLDLGWRIFNNKKKKNKV